MSTENQRGRDFSERSPIGPNVRWIWIWPLAVKRLTAQAKYFIRCFVFLTTTFSQNLKEIWGVAIFCCWPWLTTEGQTIRCFVKSYYTLTVGFICNYIPRLEWTLKWCNVPDISRLGIFFSAVSRLACRDQIYIQISWKPMGEMSGKLHHFIFHSNLVIWLHMKPPFNM